MQTTRGSLLVRIKNRGDGAAWREFDAIYRPMLYRFASARGLDDAQAEDIVQQCMVAVHEHIDTFEYDPSKGRFKGWLRTLVNNRVRNLFRDRREQPAESKDLRRGQQREPAPEEIFDKLWMEEHLKHCLRLVRQEVEESTFKAFAAYVIEEQPVEKVCADLAVTPNQLYKIKWRVTQMLGQKMKELTA